MQELLLGAGAVPHMKVQSRVPRVHGRRGVSSQLQAIDAQAVPPQGAEGSASTPRSSSPSHRSGTRGVAHARAPGRCRRCSRPLLRRQCRHRARRTAPAR